MKAAASAVTLLLAAGCGHSASTPAVDTGPSDDPKDYQVDTSVDYDVSFSAPRWVVPSAGMPVEVVNNDQPSNNNCDITFFDHRLFLAFRTSETHFASVDTVEYVVSSADDGATWQFEYKVQLDTDVREPRFLNFGGKLIYHYFQAGSDPTQFTPISMWRTQRTGLGQWTAPEKWGREGEIEWDFMVRNGKAYFTSYAGNHYAAGMGSISVFFQESLDGLSWHPLDAANPAVYVGGVSEVAYEFAPDGMLWAVLRNEDGDNTGFGAQVCSAAPGALGKWTCLDHSIEDRYDSPKMFRHGNDIYLVARRDLNGHYDEHLEAAFPDFDKRKQRYLIDYWNRPKRTALYKLDTVGRKVDWVFDFPSAGDTAFPGIRRTGPHTFLMVNYTSPIGPDDNKDISWLTGQTNPKGTQIYLTTITFTPTAAN
jgi:hypothetical protein